MPSPRNRGLSVTAYDTDKKIELTLTRTRGILEEYRAKVRLGQAGLARGRHGIRGGYNGPPYSCTAGSGNCPGSFGPCQEKCSGVLSGEHTQQRIPFFYINNHLQRALDSSLSLP
jgi:hypothetical protein